MSRRLHVLGRHLQLGRSGLDAKNRRLFRLHNSSCKSDKLPELSKISTNKKYAALATIFMLWFAKQKLFGQNHRERSLGFLWHCILQAAQGFGKGGYELLTGGPGLSRTARFHLSMAVAQKVVQWGDVALWHDPRNYLAVQDIANTVAKRTLRLVCDRSGINCKEIKIDTNLRGLEIHLPEDSGSGPSVYLLYLHGGGYCSGCPEGRVAFVSRLLKAISSAISGPRLDSRRKPNVRAIVLAYPLAPKFPFPAAVHSTLKTLQWIKKLSCTHLVAVAGDSAGGGLAIASAVAYRDLNEGQVCGIVAISPMLDLRWQNRCYNTKLEKKDIISGLLARGCSRTYLAGTSPSHPWASPAHAELEGIRCRMLLQCGGDEIFSEEIATFAAKNPEHVQLEVYDEMPHCFQCVASGLPQSIQANDNAGQFLAGCFGNV